MSKRRLLLLRHGKAEAPDFATTDFDRSLTHRGQKAARLIGTYLSEHEFFPDLVLCSPSVRTRETLLCVLETMGSKPPTRFLDALYDAPTDVYLNQIANNGGSAGTLLVVGHNPSTEAATTRLCANREDLPAAFPTCALAVFDCAIGAWEDLRPQSGTLVSFVRPRDLEVD